MGQKAEGGLRCADFALVPTFPIMQQVFLKKELCCCLLDKNIKTQLFLNFRLKIMMKMRHPADII